MRAWGTTYGLPYVITNCSNNYGPYQFPEKLIPLTIERTMSGEPSRCTETGENVRDWLYVDDHCRALRLAFDEGVDASTYCIGGSSEVANIDLVTLVVDLVDEYLGRDRGESRGLITHVEDRPGHDHRYAIDTSFAERSLGWRPQVSLDDGIRHTIEWYVGHRDWLEAVSSDQHREFQREWYKDRGGR